MIAERFEFSGYDNTKLPAVIWWPEGTVKSVLQVTHGMTEHMDRYEALAKELTEKGIAVAGFDLRGHGRNPGDAAIASFGEGGWEASIEDMQLFYLRLRCIFPKSKHFMLGFSLGSFLLQEYLEKYPDGIDGAVIVGTGVQPKLLLSVMMWIVKTQIRKAGFDNTTDLVKKLSFGTYNQEFQPNRTEADWLISDQAQLDTYLADPLCRKTISAGLLWQMLGAMKHTGNPKTFENWHKDMPVLLISGKDDPVGNFGEGIRKLREQMKEAEITELTLYLLPGARHDVLHEETCGADSARIIIGNWIERRQA